MNPEDPREIDLLIREAIRAEGSLGFEQFLSLALYHPSFGYYASGTARVGKRGDFCTNTSHGPAYGFILAGQAKELWLALGKPSPFHLVEQGANDGTLALDILSAILQDTEFFSAVKYLILEPFSALQAIQNTRLRPFAEKISWSPDDTFDPVVGLHLSNELLDAIPFARIQWDGSQWKERKVVLDANDELGWELKPIKKPSFLWNSVAKIPGNLPHPYETEVRPGLRPWAHSVSRILSKGVVLLCDYGYRRSEYYSPLRNEGTVWCYRNHQRDEDPLESPGRKDISAHVDFTSVHEYCVEAGFLPIGFTDQHRFLVGAAESWMRGIGNAAISDSSQKLLSSLRFLIHPETLGRRFYHMAFCKNLPHGFRFSGFRYARDSDLS